MKKLIFYLLLILSFCYLKGQNNNIDSLSKKSLKYKDLIIPSTLLAYGIIGLESHSIKFIDLETHEEITEHIDTKLSIDDFSQYTPFLSVYGLNAIGIKGKNNFEDRTIILGTAYLVMGGTVNLIKRTGNVVRPDGSSKDSFPSGHTATAFMGAEFLHQEYKDISIWYSIAGYVVATGTGFFRMYNDRHWLTDISAGAGIGIFSTKIAYWVYPLIKNKIFNGKETTKVMIFPFYNEVELGMSAIISF